MSERTRLTADDIKRELGLAPHPTCGFVTEAYAAQRRIPASALPPDYGGDRAEALVLYFLVTHDVRIRLHRIRSDQMYHHYLGDPLAVLMVPPGEVPRVATVGRDLANGMRPQLLLPGGTWHVSRVVPGGDYALLGTTEWPGFDPADLDLGDAGELAERHPEVATTLSAFVGANPPAPA